jgi:hypothetical protein
LKALRLDHEYRAIELALRHVEPQKRFDLHSQPAVRPADLQSALLYYRPRIVHFSGHGEVDGIYLENEAGRPHKVKGHALARIFGALKAHIRCVVLNACYTQDQAEAIAKDIDCVVGMSAAIGDKAAIQFSPAFYQALGFGSSVREAFDLACAQIDLAGLEEGDTPKLIALRLDPSRIFLIDEFTGNRLDQGSLHNLSDPLNTLPKTASRILETEPSKHRVYDLFLSHNSEDKPAVCEIAAGLKRRHFTPWLDTDELTPGRPWQDLAEEAIQTCRAAAVFVGPSGTGPWEHEEMRACLTQAVKRKIAVIPVLLPGATKMLDLPLFLRERTWVDLRTLGVSPEGLDLLVWGITGTKPRSKPRAESNPPGPFSLHNLPFLTPLATS